MQRRDCSPSVLVSLSFYVTVCMMQVSLNPAALDECRGEGAALGQEAVPVALASGGRNRRSAFGCVSLPTHNTLHVSAHLSDTDKTTQYI